ncbi:alpha/beta fold hydrolase [Deinococcus knuensis]|uniref:Alpha/beta hydrolase n=1 Tax=Deinococcus knuensis TaxID=1837380 RepID=A0ABQ2SHM8_9DEIO|nr:alpha/beta hydrolase [Deinococcus knuensis]GGS26167.1 alpha/beta hydrolase [Deinococcus knuensis]
MAYVTTPDGTDLYFKDWGQGPPVVFSHGWPLNADAWEDQMMFLTGHGYRVVAHDRRGHGRSSQPWGGQTMDTFADDLAAVIEHLDLRDVTLVGHSTGGGEVARYVARHGTARVKKVVLVGAVVPLLIQTEHNPHGVPRDVIDGIRQGVQRDRSQYFRDFAPAFYGANRPGSAVSQGQQDTFWLGGMQASLASLYDCVTAFSETDQTADLHAFDVPTLIIHGDDDQIVPIQATAMRAAELVRGSVLKTYEGAPHGLATTHKDQLNADLLSFIRG